MKRCSLKSDSGNVELTNIKVYSQANVNEMHESQSQMGFRRVCNYPSSELPREISVSEVENYRERFLP
jgi:hypothetical protein